MFARYQYKDDDYEIPGARTQLANRRHVTEFPQRALRGRRAMCYAIRPNIYNEFRAGLVILDSSSDADNRGQDVLDRAGIAGLESARRPGHSEL